MCIRDSSIAAREKIKNHIQVYSLNFVSQELVKNQRLKVMQSLTASWSDIVKKMLTDTTYLDTKKDIVIEPSAGVKKFVSPNIKPIILFFRKWCTNRSFFIFCYKINNIFY